MSCLCTICNPYFFSFEKGSPIYVLPDELIRCTVICTEYFHLSYLSPTPFSSFSIETKFARIGQLLLRVILHFRVETHFREHEPRFRKTILQLFTSRLAPFYNLDEISWLYKLYLNINFPQLNLLNCCINGRDHADITRYYIIQLRIYRM